MPRTDWSGALTLEAFDDGAVEGTRAAARELMDAIRAVGVTSDTWGSIDLAEIVGQWLDNHGINMRTPRPASVRRVATMHLDGGIR